MGLKLNDFYKAKIAKDNRKYKERLGWEVNLFKMINEGLIEVVGMRNKGPEKGELEYSTTAKGKEFLNGLETKDEANNIIQLFKANHNSFIPTGPDSYVLKYEDRKEEDGDGNN